MDKSKQVLKGSVMSLGSITVGYMHLISRNYSSCSSLGEGGKKALSGLWVNVIQARINELYSI